MRHTIQIELDHLSDGTAIIDLKTEKLPENKIISIQRISASNDTTGAKKVHLGLIIGRSIMWLETLTLTTAGDFYAMVEPIWANSCRGVVVRFAGTVSGDRLRAFIYGYYQD